MDRFWGPFTVTVTFATLVTGVSMSIEYFAEYGPPPKGQLLSTDEDGSKSQSWSDKVALNRGSVVLLASMFSRTL